MKYRIARIVSVVLIVSVLVFLTGCSKEETIAPSAESDGIASDAAYSISLAAGDESGGVTESFGDLLTVQAQGTIKASMPAANGDIETVSADSGSYDPLTGWWNVSVIRSRIGVVSSSFQRNYTFRFWKNATEFQQYYNVNGTTAVTMEFRIVSGSGYFIGPIISHRLTQLQGAFRAANISSDTVTITLDENYIRSGVDSIITRQVTRTLAHSITIFKEGTSVKTLRFRPSILRPAAVWRSGLHTAISGTVYGHIIATATLTKNDFYRERSIDQDFMISFIRGNKKGRISLGQNSDHGSFDCDLESGERNN